MYVSVVIKDFQVCLAKTIIQIAFFSFKHFLKYTSIPINDNKRILYCKPGNY